MEQTQSIGIDPGAVLVVDDAGIVRSACQRALARAGYSVSTAEDGEAGLRAMSQKAADVVLCDIRMPGISGIDVLKKVREKWPRTEVVIMTAYADCKIAEQCLNLGANEILIKPFEDLKIMLQTVAKSMIRAKLHQCPQDMDDHTLEKFLIDQKLCGQEEIERAKAHAAANRQSLRQAVTAIGIISGETIDRSAARFMAIPYVHLQETILNRELIEVFPSGLAHAYVCLPLWEEDGVLHLVMNNPQDREAIGRIEQALGLKIKPVKAAEEELRRLIKKYYGTEFDHLSLAELAARMQMAPPGECLQIIIAIFRKAGAHRVKLARINPSGDEYLEFELSVLLKKGAG